MTFKVVATSDARETVVGTIWAEAEAQAQMMASNLLTGHGPVVVRRAEDREIPMRVAEASYTSPYAV